MCSRNRIAPELLAATSRERDTYLDKLAYAPYTMEKKTQMHTRKRTTWAEQTYGYVVSLFARAVSLPDHGGIKESTNSVLAGMDTHKKEHS